MARPWAVNDPIVRRREDLRRLRENLSGYPIPQRPIVRDLGRQGRTLNSPALELLGTWTASLPRPARINFAVL